MLFQFQLVIVCENGGDYLCDIGIFVLSCSFFNFFLKF
jgi:hypothetical protein